jgi:hypothetical protein
MNKIITSKIFSLNWYDIIKALIVAILTPILVVIQNSLSMGEITINPKTILIVGLSGGLGYLIKNFFTPSQTIIKDDNKPSPTNGN